MSGPAPEPRAPVVHRTYSSLVQGDFDLVGHVAYALYKRDKLKFCDEARARSGTPPTSDEIDVFIRTCNIDTRLIGFRSEAERLLESFTEFQIEDVTKEIQRQADEALLEALSRGKSLWRVVGEALLGSVAVAVVWAGIVVIVLLNKYGPSHVIDIVTKVEVTSTPDTMVSPKPSSAASQ